MSAIGSGEFVRCVEPDADGLLKRGAVYWVVRVWSKTTKGCEPHGPACRAPGLYLAEAPLMEGLAWCGARFERAESVAA